MKNYDCQKIHFLKNGLKLYFAISLTFYLVSYMFYFFISNDLSEIRFGHA